MLLDTGRVRVAEMKWRVVEGRRARRYRHDPIDRSDRKRLFSRRRQGSRVQEVGGRKDKREVRRTEVVLGADLRDGTSPLR